MRSYRVGGASIALALCCLAVVGCSADPAPSASPSDASATPGVAADPDTTALASPAPADAAGGVDASPCLDEQLSLEYRARPQDSGAGSFYGDLVFTNTSATGCSFDGWPGLIAEDADGTQLGAPAHTEGTTVALVSLSARGGVGIARLHGTNPGAYDCPASTSAALRASITPDGAGSGVVVSQAIPVCTDGTATLAIGPLEAG